jgi:hypothetical protein
MAIHAAGAEAARLYIDSIDEAAQKAAQTGKKPAGPRAPRRQVNDIARRRLKDAEKLAKQQRKLLVTLAGDPVFTKAFNETTKTITNLIETIRRGHESERKAFGGLSEEQLDAVFRSQLHRVASKLDEGERRMLLTVWFGEEIAEVLLKPRMAERPMVVDDLPSPEDA